MRKARGKLDQLSGYFHLEDSLRDEAEPFARDACFDYEAMLLQETENAGLELIFWQFHPHGFGLLLKKPAPDAKVENIPPQPSGFIKTLKQRIAVHYNRQRGTPGKIWRDRSKVFHVPDSKEDCIEVAAYIAARPRIECGRDFDDWPSTCRAAMDREAKAQRKMIELFNQKQFTAEVVSALKQEKSRILEQYAKPVKTGRRGRKPEWRPRCEQGTNANAQVPPPGMTEYARLQKQAKNKFFEMLQRYEAICARNNFEKIPRGFPGADELRAWAIRLRGEFHRDRMPAWQEKALAGTKILEPLNARTTQPAVSPHLAADDWKLPDHLL